MFPFAKAESTQNRRIHFDFALNCDRAVKSRGHTSPPKNLSAVKAKPSPQLQSLQKQRLGRLIMCKYIFHTLRSPNGQLRKSELLDVFSNHSEHIFCDKYHMHRTWMLIKLQRSSQEKSRTSSSSCVFLIPTSMASRRLCMP